MKKIFKFLFCFSILLLCTPFIFAQKPKDHVFISEGVIDGESVKVEITLHNYIGEFPLDVTYIDDSSLDNPESKTISENIRVLLYDIKSPQISFKVIQGPDNLEAFSGLHSYQFLDNPIPGFYNIGQTGEGYGNQDKATISHWVTGTLSDAIINYYDTKLDSDNFLFYTSMDDILILTPEQIDIFLETGTLPVYDYSFNELGADISKDISVDAQFNWPGLKEVLSTFEAPPKPINLLTLKSQVINFNGQDIDFKVYVIKNTTYFKLRDFARLLEDTSSEFSIEWDKGRSSIVLHPGARYTRTGKEMNFSYMSIYDKALKQTSSIYVGDQLKKLDSYLISDTTYFSLRDLATLLNITVDYNPATGHISLTSK